MNSNSIGVASRGIGKVVNGKVTLQKVLSFDIVAAPGFSGATIQIIDERILEEFKRIERNKNRKEKLNHLNKISN